MAKRATRDYNETHPNSLAARVHNMTANDEYMDENKRQWYWHNLKQEAARFESMEAWARDGFVANGSRDHDVREEDLL